VTRRRWRAQRYGWTAGLVIGYALLANYTNLNPSAKPLGAVLAIAPPLALGVGLAWRSSYRLISLASAALIAALIVLYWQVLERNFPLVYLLEDLGFYVLLSLTFARSLASGRVPLCTYWADLVHGPLPPVVARYTRNTTVAWAVFFALIAATSLALYVYAPLRVWSAFSYFVTFPLVVLMFVGEYAVRRRVLPPLHRSGLWDSVRVYLDSPRRTRVVGQ
jgi:uncharacterized membrane protein